MPASSPQKEAQEMASEIKWIKIVTDIFNDEKILIIESMPEADAIIVIWFKLLCLAGQQNNKGVFILRESFPYTDEMFAAIFRRPINTIRLALKTFEHLGMIEIINNVVTIPNWDRHQSLDAYEKRKERDRAYQQRRYYEKKAQLLVDSSTENSDETSTDTSSDIAPLDEEEDKEKEEDRDILHHEEERAEPEKAPKKEEPKEPPVFELTLNDKSKHPVYQKDVQDLQALYPAVDVEQQFRNMIGWLNSNPDKRKTKSGIKRFINSWLARQQDRGGDASRKGKPPTPPRPAPEGSNPFRRS